MLKDFTFPQYPVLPTYFLLFPLHFIILIISYFGCKETSNSHLGENAPNIGEDFFPLLLLNNFRNVGPTISFSVSITLVTHVVCGAPFTKLPQHLLQLHEFKASFLRTPPNQCFPLPGTGLGRALESSLRPLCQKNPMNLIHHQPIALPNREASVNFASL